MGLSKYLILYGLTVPVFLLIDLLWLGVVAKAFYQKVLKDFLSPKVNWVAAFIFYGLFIIGILVFAVIPALDRKSLGHAVLMGALFGFFCYATYDLTNLATLKDWPLIVVLVDIVWGAVLTGSVATCSYFLGRWLL